MGKSIACGLLGVMGLAALGCGGSSSSAPSASSGSVVGTWAFVSTNGEAGNGLTFTSQGTYVFEEITGVGNSLDAQVIKGTYVITSPGNITLTATDWSCSGLTSIQGGVKTNITYSFSGSDLVVAFPSNVYTFQPDTSTGTSVAITLGCFDSMGTFTPNPIGPAT